MNKILYDNDRKMVFHPGAYIKDAIEDEYFTFEEYAENLGLSDEMLNKLIEGELDLNDDLAEKLGKMVHTGADVWLKLQAGFNQVKNEIRCAKIPERDIKSMHIGK